MTGCAAATTLPGTRVTDRAATLNTRVQAGGDATQWWFQYGKTTSYGSATPRRDGGSATTEKSFSERINTLAPDTTYHFKACATSKSGGVCGTDRTFRTGSAGLLPGFQETTAFSGLDAPTAVRFAPDGRVFVAEKRGAIKVFDSLGDTTPTVFADLRHKVNDYWDRGLLGLALDPRLPGQPSCTRSTPTTPRSAARRRAGTTTCPTPPGADRRRLRGQRGCRALAQRQRGRHRSRC